MLIVNPIYDQAFKYMMDNEEIAKKVISIITEKNVVKIQSRPNEIKIIDKKGNIPLSRFDFKAIIEEESGEMVNILIEIQKSKHPDPIMRFRRYLGKNYLRKETIINDKGVEETIALPIHTIYILGYPIKEYDTPGILVNNQVIDTTTKKEIPFKNEFIQLLTHPSYILQTTRLRPERRTKLEKFMAIFDQSKKADDDYLLQLDEDSDDVDVLSIARYLNRGTLDEELLAQLELEEDVEEEFDKLETQLAEEKQLKEEALKQKDEALQQKEEAHLKLAKAVNRMLAKGFTIEEIAEDLDLSLVEVKNLAKI
jgi:DNA-directed RNA polymerase specialized sigma24 family protein